MRRPFPWRATEAGGSDSPPPPIIIIIHPYLSVALSIRPRTRASRLAGRGGEGRGGKPVRALAPVLRAEPADGCSWVVGGPAGPPTTLTSWKNSPHNDP
eukprot:scaffold27_cov125-Isochrysis_galbana.AAC.8